jgi:uncharacterized membrane protein
MFNCIKKTIKLLTTSDIIILMSIIIAFLACTCGVLVSLYMYSKKKHHQKLACPRDNPCDMVLHSRFGKTFGISNESLGLIYFFIVSFLLYIIISTSFAYSTVFMYLLFFLLILGGLFSLYLIALQEFVIRA